MPRTLRTSLPLALAVALLAAGAATLVAAGDGPTETHRLKLHLRTDDGGERLEIDDLGELAVGESRSLTTDSGKAVIVSRDENGYAIDLDGKTIRIADGGGDWTAAPGERVHRLHKIEIDDDGGSHVVVGDDAREHRVVVRKSADGHGFAFSTDGAAPRIFLVGPDLLDRIERSEKFLALDDATRETVREIVREASRPLAWSEEGGEADAERVEVWVERQRRDEGDDQ